MYFGKRTLFVALLLIALVSLSFAGEKKFSYSPEKPLAGGKISIRYNPEGTGLEGSKEIKMLVYQFGNVINQTDEYPLVKNNGVWSAEFTLPDTAKGVLIRFKGEDKFDDNNKKCYSITLYGKDGKILPGALGGLAVAYSSWIQYLDLDPDYETAYKLFKQEFESNPDMKKDFIGYYLRAIRNTVKENADAVVAEEIDKHAATLGESELDLMMLINLYRSNKMVDKALKYENEYKQKYPAGKFIPTFKFGEYRALKELAAKIEFLESFEAAYPGNQFIDYIYSDLISTLTKEGNFAEAAKYLTAFKNAGSYNYNSIAWSLYEKGKDLSLAEEIALKGVQKARNELNNPKGSRPQFLTPDEWLKQRKGAVAMVLDTYGAILAKLNKNIEAENALAEAVELSEGSDAEICERYATVLITNGKFAQAQKELEKYIATGNATANMKGLLKESYAKVNGSEAGFDEYYSKFELAGKKKLMDELIKQMLNENAPQFSLIDLDGKKVSLSDFKGKLVVVDFWATWCGPCLASFPGMKKAVEKYEQSGQVKFLFVNTWENVEDKKQNAQDFITKNKYPFHVLLDEKNEVVASFKVGGIPTKFIIDKEGKIRFKSVGFGGNEEAMVDEIGLMLEIIK